MHTFGLAPSLASVKRLLGCLTLLRISAILLALLMSHWLSHCHNQEGTLWIENDTHLTLNPENYLQLVHFLSSWGGHTWLQSTEYYSLNSPQSKQFNVVAGYSHEILWWDGAWSKHFSKYSQTFFKTHYGHTVQDGCLPKYVFYWRNIEWKICS